MTAIRDQIELAIVAAFDAEIVALREYTLPYGETGGVMFDTLMSLLARDRTHVAHRIAREFTTAAEDDCAECNGPKDGPHVDHDWRPRLPPSEWARPTAEQRELIRLAAGARAGLWATTTR